MTIGQTIKLYRKEKNFTQRELAELIGVSTQAISKKAESYLQNLPYVFGFRDYWEAEMSFLRVSIIQAISIA